MRNLISKKGFFVGVFFILVISLLNYLEFFDFSNKIEGEMKEENMIKITSGNATLAVKLYPKENAQTVILLHGGPGVPDEMQEVVALLKQKYQVIGFEQRGVGNSLCNDCEYLMEEYISDIDAIAKYFELDSFHLFGHSWGGLYAQIYFEKNPNKIKSLFLVSPSSGTNEVWKQVQGEVLAYNQNSVSLLTWVKMGFDSLLGMLGSDVAYQKLFKQVVQNYNKNYGGGTLSDEVLRKIRAEPINKTAKQIGLYSMLEKNQTSQVPIIITYGEDDIYGESKRLLYDRFPSAEPIILKNSGHIPWKHSPEEFSKILKSFYAIN
ncbi:MAG: alpha/beta hydrolase [Devosiaceae bacterium]|nr:alpha/beta hydrolase [Devosiaceae bacterium]